jgi:hypothetical protein
LRKTLGKVLAERGATKRQIMAIPRPRQHPACRALYARGGAAAAGRRRYAKAGGAAHRRV